MAEKKNEVWKFETIWYSSKATPEEQKAILGFVVGKPGNTKSYGYVTKVDRKNGIVTVSGKRGSKDK